VLVRATARGVSLDSPRDFTTLSLVLEGGPAAEEAAGRVGTWAGPDHLVLPASTLVELAGPVADETGWREGFDRMITFATNKGWVDSSGGVRIHVEQRR